MTTTSIKRALISVSDKSGCVAFAKALHELNIAIISTGGTSALLREANIPHNQVDDITKWPEMLEGRVKTLHPLIQGGILGKRDAHAAEMKAHHIPCIDLVVVNFYPFEDAVVNNQAELTLQDAIEYIDIGGPTLVRAAAKNFAWVSVVTDPIDYSLIIDELKKHQGVQLATRKKLAEKAFGMTARYDAMVHRYIARANETNEETQSHDDFSLSLGERQDLRYGENPHQKAYARPFTTENTSLFSATQHQGKPLSYNNLLDADAACQCLSSFDEPTCVIVKHATPCGVASRASITEAFIKALECDAKSAFGGIVALNRPCTLEIAKRISDIFMEVVVAPQFEEAALKLFQAKPNLRVLSMPEFVNNKWEVRGINGGVLVQEKDVHHIQDDMTIVTETKLTDEEKKELLFAWRVVKHIKSNAIVLTKNQATIGIGGGQVSRVDAVDLALRKAGEQSLGSVLASDAFFPFRDSIDLLAKTGVRAIIQPGGSVRDADVIQACNEAKIAMVFTGVRCFKH